MTQPASCKRASGVPAAAEPPQATATATATKKGATLGCPHGQPGQLDGEEGAGLLRAGVGGREGMAFPSLGGAPAHADGAGDKEEDGDGKEGHAGGRVAPAILRGSKNGQERRDLGGPDGLPCGGAGGTQEGGGNGEEGNAGAGGGGNLGRSAEMKFTTSQPTTRLVEQKKRGMARAAGISASPTLLPRSNFLSDALLSWSMEDLLNEDLYKTEVRIGLIPLLPVSAYLFMILKVPVPSHLCTTSFPVSAFP